MRDEDLAIPATILADRRLRPTSKLVLAQLIRLGRSGGLIFVSRFALGRDLALSTSAVEAALAELETVGQILRAVSAGGRNRPCGYRLLRAAPGLAGLRAVPAGESTGVCTKRVTQLSLFDECLGPVNNTPMRRKLGEGRD